RRRRKRRGEGEGGGEQEGENLPGHVQGFEWHHAISAQKHMFSVKGCKSRTTPLWHLSCTTLRAARDGCLPLASQRIHHILGSRRPLGRFLRVEVTARLPRSWAGAPISFRGTRRADVAASHTPFVSLRPPPKGRSLPHGRVASHPHRR